MKVVVLYLVRELDQVAAFLKSYHEHLSECGHELIFVCKGVKPLTNGGIRTIYISDCGRSLHTFSKAIRKLPEKFDVVVFLNSYSRIECDGWLRRLVEVASRPEVGAAGCTASLESFTSNKPSWWRTLLFPAWPNPHLRTNAIAMRTEIALEFWPTFAFNKPLEHIAESGWWGLTNRLRCANLKCVLVGSCFEHEIEGWVEDHTSVVFKYTPMVIDNRRTPCE